MNLNKDIHQIIFEKLALPEKYNYFIYCQKNKLFDELMFIQKYFQQLHDIPKQEWTSYLIDYPDLHEDILSIYKDSLDWYMVCIYQNMTETFMEKHINYIDWETISIHKKLSDKFIIRHCDKLQWSYLSNSERLSENIVEKFIDRIDWGILNVNNYSISFIQKHVNKINWVETFFNDINKYEVFKNYIDWERISYHNPLTEDFIRTFQDRLNWDFISSHQVLSPEFIDEFKDRLNIDSISRFMRYSQSVPSSPIDISLIPRPLVGRCLRRRRIRALNISRQIFSN